MPIRRKIAIKVISDGHEPITYKMLTHTKLSTMMKKYAECELGEPLSILLFLYDGSVLDQTDTPQMLSMNDGDIVEVVVKQTGGN